MSAALARGMDFTILCGHRGKEEQDEAVRAGHSRTPWPTSKHNGTPSLAVDIAPYPVDWHDLARFDKLAVEVKAAWAGLTDAEREGFTLSWGGDWTGFVDRPHWEVRK